MRGAEDKYEHTVIKRTARCREAFSLSNAVLKEEHTVFPTIKNAGFSVLGSPAFVMR